jgi:peptidoglycan hydrolase-like protein with peptidoglycan-binding domain
MRVSGFVIIFFLLLSFQAIFKPEVVSATVTSCSITSTLKAGARGAEVECLQRALDLVADGNFGPKTKIAVLTWQISKGLVPDGIFGTKSRAIFAEKPINPINNGKNNDTALTCPNGLTVESNCGALPVAQKGTETIKNPVDSTNGQIPEVPQNTVKSIPKTNPNAANLDKFINTVVAVNKKNGSSDAQLKLIADSLRSTVLGSSVDYNKEFKDMLVNEAGVGLNTKTPSGIFNKVITNALSFLGFTPPVAQASNGIPFGGALIFPFYCVASSNWIITMEPLPPSYALLLSYTPFTQGFASYNTPFTRFLLGSYTTGGICSYGYVNITTEGTINPVTGSSPL